MGFIGLFMGITDHFWDALAYFWGSLTISGIHWPISGVTDYRGVSISERVRFLEAECEVVCV